MNTTIFYMNSVGIISQWTGKILKMTDTSVSIQFSKNKAFRYDLSQSGLLVVTKFKMKDIGLNDLSTVLSFDDNLVARVLKATEGNRATHWNGSSWQA